MRTHGPIALALVLGILAVYSPVRNHAFVDYDDPVILLKTRPGLSAQGLAVATSDTIVANWIPATVVSWLTGQTLFGENAGPRLLGNVALHAGATLALYAAGVVATGLVWPSAFAAGVFALHPPHVESVAWFAQRKDVLCACFWLAALALHLGGGRTPSPRRRGTVWTLGVLALLSKPTAVTLPFTLVLADLWAGGGIALARRGADLGDLSRSLRAQAPLFVAAAAISVITYQVQDQTGAVAESAALPFGVRLANAALAIGAYLADSVWPRDLAAFYPHPGEAIPLAEALVVGLALVAVTAWCATRAAHWPWIFVGWCWFLGTLVPMLGLVQVGEQARADRYMYVPLIGLGWGLAFGVAHAVRGRPIAQRAGVVVGTLLLLTLGVHARAQVETWASSTTLYAQAVAATDANAFAERGLGRALRRDGREEDARPHLLEAVRLRPDHAPTRVELAELLAELGAREQAIAHYGVALELQPNELRNHVNRGRLLVREGRNREALRHLELVQARVRLGRELPMAFRRPLHLALARAYAAEARTAEAESQLRTARELDPQHPAPWIVSGDLAWQRGDRAEAARRWRAGAQRADAHGEKALAGTLRARAVQAESETSSSTESSPGTPTRSGNP
jgi:tetratricopeptide (TPR) repeat protein